MRCARSFFGRHLKRLPWILWVVVLPSALDASTEFTKGGWDEVPEEEFLAESPKVDPDAHIEFLYRGLEVSDTGGITSSFQTIYKYHYRLKVFTEAGVEELDKIDIPYETGWRLRGLKARIIFPDRTVVRLEREDFYKRELFEDGRFKGYVQSFSFPGLRPGCIVEYRWTAVRQYWIPSLYLPMLTDWPTWDYYLRVSPQRFLASRIAAFNCRYKWEKKGGDFHLHVKNLPASYEGPFLVPRKDFEPWVHMGYATELEDLDPDKYWGYRGGTLEDINDDYVRPRQGAVKKLAKTLFEGAKDREEMLHRAYDYCVSQIINISGYTDFYSEQEIEDLKQNRSPADVIKRGYGTRSDINGLFASLASVAGFEKAYLGQVENRSDHTFNYDQVGFFCLSDWLVAVLDGTTWRFFDPGSTFLPFETLNPENTNGRVIVADEKYYYWRKTNPVEAKSSNAIRKATLQLSEEGDLQGEVVVSFTGYEALWRRRLFAEMTNQEIEDYLRDEDWANRCPRAVISALEVQGKEDPNQKLELRYSLEIPAYAEFAGDRLIFNPSVFEKGSAPVFKREDRAIGVRFEYPFREYDDVSIGIPEGYSLETGSFSDVGFAGSVLNQNRKVEFDETARTLRFLRLMVLDTEAFERMVDVGARTLRLPGPPYREVKVQFDEVNRLDAQDLSLVRE